MACCYSSLCCKGEGHNAEHHNIECQEVLVTSLNACKSYHILPGYTALAKMFNYRHLNYISLHIIQSHLLHQLKNKCTYLTWNSFK